MDAALGPALKEGVRVVLHGLVKRKEQNGLAGVLGQFQPKTGRWAVTLDGCTELVALKPQNLQLKSVEALLAADVIASISAVMHPADLSAAECVCREWREGVRPRRLQLAVYLTFRVRHAPGASIVVRMRGPPKARDQPVFVTKADPNVQRVLCTGALSQHWVLPAILRSRNNTQVPNEQMNDIPPLSTLELPSISSSPNAPSPRPISVFVRCYGGPGCSDARKAAVFETYGLPQPTLLSFSIDTLVDEPSAEQFARGLKCVMETWENRLELAKLGHVQNCHEEMGDPFLMMEGHAKIHELKQRLEPLGVCASRQRLLAKLVPLPPSPQGTAGRQATDWVELLDDEQALSECFGPSGPYRQSIRLVLLHEPPVAAAADPATGEQLLKCAGALLPWDPGTEASAALVCSAAGACSCLLDMAMMCRGSSSSGGGAAKPPWCTDTILLVLLEAAVAAMRAHGANESVQLAGCLLLKRVARAPRSSDLLLPWQRLMRGACEAVASAMEEWPRRVHIQVRGLAALSAIASVPGGPLPASVALPTVVATLQRSSNGTGNDLDCYPVLGGSYLSALLPLPLIAGSYHSEPLPLPGSPGAAAAAARDAHERVRELWDEYYDDFLGSENPFCVLSDSD